MPYGIGYKKKRMSGKPIIKGKLKEATMGADSKLKKAIMGADQKLSKKKKMKYRY